MITNKLIKQILRITKLEKCKKRNFITKNCYKKIIFYLEKENIDKFTLRMVI